MSRFLRKIIFFTLLSLILAVVGDVCISNILKQSPEYAGEFEVMNDIYDGEASCDIAIYGVSRALVHFDPKIISDSLNESVYNFGIDGHGFWLQHLRHLEFLKHNAKPKVIILATDAYSLEKKSNLYQQNQFLPYMLWNRNIKEYTSSYNGFSVLDYYIPLIRYFGKKNILKSCMIVLFKRNEKYRTKGYRSVDRKWTNDLANAKSKMEKFEVKIDTSSIQLFKNFILECKKSKIELVFVCAPEYIEGQEFVSNRKEVVNIYKNLATKHELLFLDYSENEICLDTIYFYNATHLNSVGSEKFSKILAMDIKSKLLKAY